MGIKNFKPYTPSRRAYSVSDFVEITKSTPEKSLIRKLSKTGGRNNKGRMTNINKGGGHKRRYRVIDFKRNKIDIPAKVISVEYDPNRTARIALICYADGEKTYILAPQALVVGDTIIRSEQADIKPGNAMTLRSIPTGQNVHCVEMKIGHGAQMVRTAGGSALLRAKEGDYAQLRLPSGEIRRVHLDCVATIGVLGNAELKNLKLGKAGRSRWLGRRPHTRGVAKNPVDHPMGGGEGRSSGGRHPCTPKGKPTKGLKTRKNKRTDVYIVKRRNSKKG